MSVLDGYNIGFLWGVLSTLAVLNLIMCVAMLFKKEKDGNLK